MGSESDAFIDCVCSKHNYFLVGHDSAEAHVLSPINFTVPRWSSRTLRVHMVDMPNYFPISAAHYAWHESVNNITYSKYPMDMGSNVIGLVAINDTSKDIVVTEGSPICIMVWYRVPMAIEAAKRDEILMVDITRFPPFSIQDQAPVY